MAASTPHQQSSHRYGLATQRQQLHRYYYKELCNRSSSCTRPPPAAAAVDFEDYWEDASVSLRSSSCTTWDSSSLDLSPDLNPLPEPSLAMELQQQHHPPPPLHTTSHHPPPTSPPYGLNLPHHHHHYGQLHVTPRHRFPPPVSSSCITMSTIKEGGRFVLKEVMDSSFCCSPGLFRAERVNGRLLLHLVRPCRSGSLNDVSAAADGDEDGEAAASAVAEEEEDDDGEEDHDQKAFEGTAEAGR